MESQFSPQFNEAPKMPLHQTEEYLAEMKAVQNEYGTTKPLAKKADGKWYIEAFGEKEMEISEWSRLDKELYSKEEGDRSDIN